jgi:multidrug efflux system membrane fusion protein
MNTIKNHFGKLTLGVVLIAGAIFGSLHFAHAKSGGEPAQAASSMPAVPVKVRTVSEEKVRVWSEFSGRLHAVDFAEIRPEVSGRITEVRIEDGQSVKEGEILFIIDPRPYEAAVARAEANLASARNKEDLAKIDQARVDSIKGTGAMAQREVDQIESANRVATSDKAVAEAELLQARVDLDHAYVKAPISGRISRAEITVGNLVQSGPTAPVLTSIVSENGIYADFEVDEQTYMETIRNAANGNEQEQQIPVQLVVAGDKGHVYEGRIHSFDNRIDVTSGTIRARAKFVNTDQALVPGMFVSVRLAGSQEQSAVLVPERAIGSDQSKKFVYVVGTEGRAAYREIELGRQMEGQRVVSKGLQAGDRVIVDGIQHVRPSAPVEPTELAETKKVRDSDEGHSVAQK